MESTLRKCLSDSSQGFRGKQRKHRRSFKQERSILAIRQYLAQCRKEQLDFLLEGVLQEPRHGHRSGGLQGRESALSSTRYSRKEKDAGGKKGYHLGRAKRIGKKDESIHGLYCATTNIRNGNTGQVGSPTFVSTICRKVFISVLPRESPQPFPFLQMEWGRARAV